MEDLRHTAYACHEAAKEELDEAINAFFDEMDTNRDKRISFDEFKRYMKTVDCERYGSKRHFFDKLTRHNNDYLEYCDVVMLLYIVNCGRPFCQECERFIEGLYFTCVQCFEKEGDYAFNFCPSCYYINKNHDHCHKEFMDPISLLRLKKKKELVEGQQSGVQNINNTKVIYRFIYIDIYMISNIVLCYFSFFFFGCFCRK